MDRACITHGDKKFWFEDLTGREVFGCPPWLGG